MSRIRTIKPEFWTSEQVMQLPRDARLLFIGMWNFADDLGRLKWSPKRLRAQVMPGDSDVTDSLICEWLSLIAQCGLIDRYVNGGVEYAQVSGWEHQRINRPNGSKYPGPLDPGSRFTEHSVSDHGSITDGREGKGREGNYSLSLTFERGASGDAAPPCEPEPTAPKRVSKRNVASDALKSAVKRLAPSHGLEVPPTASRAHWALGAATVAGLVEQGGELGASAERVAKAAYERLEGRLSTSFGYALQDLQIGAPRASQVALRPSRILPSRGTTQRDWEGEEDMNFEWEEARG